MHFTCFDTPLTSQSSICIPLKLYDPADTCLWPITSPGLFPFKLFQTKSMELGYYTAWLWWDKMLSQNTRHLQRFSRNTMRKNWQDEHTWGQKGIFKLSKRSGRFLSVRGGVIKKDIQRTRRVDVEWIHLAQDRDQCWPLVNMIQNLGVP